MLRGYPHNCAKKARPPAWKWRRLSGFVNNAIESTRSLARGLSPVER